MISCLKASVSFLCDGPAKNIEFVDMSGQPQTSQPPNGEVYRSKKFYGKMSIMCKADSKIGNVADGLSSQELSEIVHAIQQDDLDLLSSLLNQASGKSISDRMVTVTLPKNWHHVVKNVMSTPLRATISWRNVKALDMILDSKCVVSPEDICAGFQKILRHIHTDVDIDIVRHLVSRGATTESPVHLTLAFEKIFLSGAMIRCYQLVKVSLKSKPSNNLLGQMLLSVSKRSAKYQSSDELNANFLNKHWHPFAIKTSKAILRSGFSPSEFIGDIKVWLAFGRVAFQHIVHALPLMVQTMPYCPVEAMGWVLRHVGRYFPHTSTEGRAKVRQVPRLMWAAGINLPRVMNVACLSPRFMVASGFTKWTKIYNTEVRSLQHHCRAVIRNNVATGNVFRAMQKTTCLPTPVKDYILLKDIQLLPWEETN